MSKRAPQNELLEGLCPFINMWLKVSVKHTLCFKPSVGSSEPYSCEHPASHHVVVVETERGVGVIAVHLLDHLHGELGVVRLGLVPEAVQVLVVHVVVDEPAVTHKNMGHPAKCLEFTTGFQSWLDVMAVFFFMFASAGVVLIRCLVLKSKTLICPYLWSFHALAHSWTGLNSCSLIL